MKTTQAKEMIDASVARLTQALNAGHSEPFKAYLKAVGRFHHYSFGNTLLIWSQRPDATHVAGFHAWKKWQRAVCKGEKGIAIIAPLVNSAKAETDSDDAELSVLGFKVVYVFDLAQTSGRPFPVPPEVKGNPAWLSAAINKCITAKGIALSYRDLAGPLGLSYGGRIEIQQGLSAALDFSVRVHELAHEILHRGENNALPKARKELEAEAVAFLVSDWAGLDTNTAFSDYILSYKADQKMLVESLSSIKKVASQIVSDLERLRAS